MNRFSMRPKEEMEDATPSSPTSCDQESKRADVFPAMKNPYKQMRKQFRTSSRSSLREMMTRTLTPNSSSDSLQMRQPRQTGRPSSELFKTAPSISEAASRENYEQDLSRNLVTPDLSDASPEARTTPTTPGSDDGASLESAKIERVHVRVDSAQPVDVMVGTGSVDESQQHEGGVSVSIGHTVPAISSGYRAWGDILDSVPAASPPSPCSPVEEKDFLEPPSTFPTTAIDVPASPTKREPSDSDDQILVPSDLMGKERVDAIREFFGAKRSHTTEDPHIQQCPSPRIPLLSARPLTAEEHDKLHELSKQHHSTLLLTLDRLDANLASAPPPQPKHPRPQAPPAQTRKTQTTLLTSIPHARLTQTLSILTARNSLRHNSPHFIPTNPDVATQHARTAAHTAHLDAAARPHRPLKPDPKTRRSFYLTPVMADPGTVETASSPTSGPSGADGVGGAVDGSAVVVEGQGSGREALRGGGRARTGTWPVGGSVSGKVEEGLEKRWRPLAMAVKREVKRCKESGVGEWRLGLGRSF